MCDLICNVIVSREMSAECETVRVYECKVLLGTRWRYRHLVPIGIVEVLCRRWGGNHWSSVTRYWGSVHIHKRAQTPTRL